MTDSSHLIESIGRYFEGDLPPEEAEALFAALHEDEALRRTFVACAMQRRMLSRLYEVEFERVQGSGFGVRERVRSWEFRMWSWVALAALIALAATVWLAWPSTPHSALHTPHSVPVAVLTNAHNAVWAADSQAGSVTPMGSNLPRGHLALVSGRGDLMMTSGAQVALVGDCRFDLTGPNGGYLHSGLLIADVPPQARGFSVRAPHDVTVIDLGTRFSMFVDEGGSDVLVTEGQVAVKVGQRVAFLQAGGSMRIRGGETEPRPLSARRLARLMPPARYVHVGFDQAPRIVEPDGSYATRTLTISHQARIDGRFGQALHLDGSSAIDTDLPGVDGKGPRTVAAWIRIPESAVAGEAYAIVAWGDPAAPGGKWQVGWNRDTDGGVAGALRCEVAHGWIIGSTDLRDGQWHHIAIVFAGDDIEATKLYLDGEPDPASDIEPQRINTRPGSLQIGRYLNTNNRFFRGDIDELYVIESALSPRQIKTLMHDNQLRFNHIPSASGESE